MIQRLARSSTILSLFLIPSILLLTFASTLQGQTVQQPEPVVRNADWNVVGNEIVVTYDLSGPAEGDYDVTVTFLNEDDKNVHVPLVNAAGDIGTVRGPAAGKTIKWNYQKDVPARMSGNRFYFGFDVRYKGIPPAEEGHSSWVWILLLVGVVAGVALLFSSGSSDQQ